MSNYKDNGPFISVIKVKGIHLLPPVITQKKRAELQGYKQQAIKLEKRLKNCRDLKKNLEDLLNMQALTERPYSEISFRDNSHVEALGIAENKIHDNHILPINKAFKNIKLSQDIIDVTQYNNDGIKIIYNDKNCVTSHQEYQLSPYSSATNSNTNTSLIKQNQIGPLLQPTNNQNNSNAEGCNSDIIILNGDSSNNNSLENISIKDISSTLEKSPKPRLIRSNSYTLETPSPILLAHLEKTEKSKDNEAQNIENLSISRNWSSLENNYMPFEESNFSSINTVYNTNFDHSSREKIQSSTHCINEGNTVDNTNFDHSSNEKIQASTPDYNKEDKLETSTSPAIKVIQTDISVQNITVSANNEILNEALNENCETSDSQLLQALKALPDLYAKQIIELIESQKNKQKLISDNENINRANEQVLKSDDEKIIKEDNIMNNRTENLLNSALSNLKSDCQSNVHKSLSFSGSDKLRGSATSISPSQSVYYSVTSSDTIRPLSNCSVRLFDFECDDAVIYDEKSGSPQKMIDVGYSVREEIRKRMDVSRELFPELDINVNSTLKREWAASIIGAHARGYLTRRLLKTERVQSLIETIKDALMCALQLHNAENIDESDVELHRRLINQVSAACYTFHDIFFALTVQEQMLIIATDRQCKLEKAKRPSSAPIGRRSKSSSTRSTPRQQRVPSHSRSLTKV